jgi:hypothetical protein
MTTIHEMEIAVRRKAYPGSFVFDVLASSTYPMKKMKIFFNRLFSKPERRRSVISDALSEAFLDFFKEMGYKTNRKQ